MIQAGMMLAAALLISLCLSGSSVSTDGVQLVSYLALDHAAS